MICYGFSKIQAEINKKRKRQNHPPKPSWGVIWPFFESSGGTITGFVVWGLSSPGPIVEGVM